MKKILFFGALVLSTIFSMQTFAKASEEQLDQIIAVVNDDVITKTEFNKALSLIKLQLSQNGALPPADVLKKEVLNQLINKKLQLQIAKQANVAITDNDLNRAINMIAQQNNVSVATLYDRISNEGMSVSTYKQEMRDQLTLQKLQQQEVISRITVSPSEVERFARAQTLRQASTAKEYHLEDILIPFSDSPTDSEINTAQQNARAISAKINAGENPTALAANRKDVEVKDMGWLNMNDIPTAFVSVLPQLKANQISSPIQTGNGVHIVRLVATRADTSNATAPDRKQVEEALLQRKFEEAVQVWLSKLRAQAFIETDAATKKTYA